MEDTTDPPAHYYEKSEFIETHTGNRVGRKSILCGSQNIRLHGKTIVMPGAMIRGDLGAVNVGKYSVIGRSVVIRPPHKRYQGSVAFFPITIGDYVHIEEDCIVSAASIGSYIHIGRGSVLGRHCVLKDCCWIEENSVLAPGTVVPHFAIFGGTPAVRKGQLPECFQEMQKEASLINYSTFLPRPEAASTSTSFSNLPTVRAAGGSEG